MQRCHCFSALWWYLWCSRGFIAAEGAPGERHWGIPDPPTLCVAPGSLQCSGIEDSSGMKRILVLFTPSAPSSSPLVAGSKPLSLLLGPAGIGKLSHFLMPKGKRYQVVNTVGSVEGQERGCHLLHSFICSPLISLEFQCTLCSLCGAFFFFLKKDNI